MKNKLSLSARKFLAACRISAERPRHSDEEFLHACGIDTTLTPEEFRDANKHRDFSDCRGCGARTFEQHTAECRHRTLDGTERLLNQFGIPATRENYLALAFDGKPPQEPLDGEIEAELPIELQRENMADINNAPSAGECDEPSYTTLRKFPICARCGKSTRNTNQLVCAPCRNRTRLLLTGADKQLLREMGIAR
ncbi:MAG: hypothetical protein WCA19_00070 [Candidatus Acidiferrales bacterium]